MADEQHPSVPDETPEQQPDYASRIAELERERDRERAQREAYEKSWNLIAQQQQPQQREAMAQGLVRLPPESARRIGQTLGGDWAKEEVVQAHVPIFAAFLQELAGPLLQGIEGMADTVDLIQAKQDVPQYETVSEEADRVRTTYRQRGQVISRKEAVALVKARRMEDPKYMDELVEKRAAQRAVEQADRGAAAAAAVSPGGSAEKVGPAPTKGSRGPLTREQFERLSLEEKRQALADVRI
jgi:hypothetical protein